MPDVAILVLSQHVQRRYAMTLLTAGADGVGYLLEQRVADIDGFCADARRRLCAGGAALDSEVVATMLTRARHDDPLERLTPRQREVLALMAEGLIVMRGQR